MTLLESLEVPMGNCLNLSRQPVEAQEGVKAENAEEEEEEGSLDSHQPWRNHQMKGHGALKNRKPFERDQGHWGAWIPSWAPVDEWALTSEQEAFVHLEEEAERRLRVDEVACWALKEQEEGSPLHLPLPPRGWLPL
jgi:hypothetical protein